MKKGKTEEALADAFLAGLGYVGLMFAAGDDPAATWIAIGAPKRPGLRIVTRLTIRRRGHAELLLHECEREFGAVTPAPLAPRAAVVSARRLAAEQGVKLMTDAQRAALADPHVGTIDKLLDDLSRTGGLKDFNRRYKELRTLADSRGQNTPGYGVYLASLKARIAGLIGRNIAARHDPMTGFASALPRMMRDIDAAMIRSES